MALTNYLALEALIVTALTTAAIPGLATIRGVRELPEPQDLARWALPAVLVVYRGDNVPTDRDSFGDDRQIVDQEWMLVLCVKNVADLKGGSGQRADAGVLLLAVNGAVAGQQLAPEFGPLQRVNGPANLFGDQFALFPLVYRSRLVT